MAVLYYRVSEVFGKAMFSKIIEARKFFLVWPNASQHNTIAGLHEGHSCNQGKKFCRADATNLQCTFYSIGEEFSYIDLMIFKIISLMSIY